MKLVLTLGEWILCEYLGSSLSLFCFGNVTVQMCASFCTRYEDEINKRNAAENEFVGLKKVRELGRK